MSVVAAPVVLASHAVAQTTPAWRYDLQTGDHLTYQYSFHRQTESSEEHEHVRTQVEVRFQSNVVVTGTNAGRITLGFQRNRESAEMTEYNSNGKDKLAKEKIDFDRRMQTRQGRFSEAMEISTSGEPFYAWNVARETYSHMIQALHEVMNLPPVSVQRGEVWHGIGLSGMDFRWEGDESVHGKSCHRVVGSLPNGWLKLTYWWSQESGVIEEIDYEANYENYGTTHESARMELKARTREQKLDQWLASPDTRLAALQALLQSPRIPLSAAQLAIVLDEDEVQNSATSVAANKEKSNLLALALAVAIQRKIALSPEVVSKLHRNTSEQIKTLLVSLEEPTSSSPIASPREDDCHHALQTKAPPENFGTFVETTVGAGDETPISYLLRIPLSYRADRASPLLVYLSGGGGFAIDAMSTGEDVISDTGYLAVYPQAGSLWWTREASGRFDAVFNDVLRRYNVDRDRIYITGFSNGGTGALYYATLWPQRFAAVVSLMGAGQCNEQVKAGLGNVRNIPLLFVHGENDPVITPDCSTTTQAALSDLHPAIDSKLKILRKHAHDITLQSDDGLTLEFFKDKVRNAFPRTVDLAETDGLATRAYWVEIVDGKAGKSDIDARMKADNTIEIRSRDIKSIRLHLRPELFPKNGSFRVVWNGKKLGGSETLHDICSRPAAATGDGKLDYADTRNIVLP